MNRRHFLRAATGCAVVAAPVVALNHEYRVIDLGCYGTPVQKQLVEIFNAALDQLGDELNRQLIDFYCDGRYAAHCASIKSKET